MPHLARNRSFRPWVAAFAAMATTIPASTYACIVFVPPKLNDVSYAEVVVIGRIENYQIVRDEAFRKRMLALPKLPADMRKRYQDPKGGATPEYARFTIRVEQVLVGQARDKLSVTWNNSTFGEPNQMKLGRHLIALRRSGRSTFTPLQAPCSSAFIYEAGSEQARTIRAILRAGKR